MTDPVKPKRPEEAARSFPDSDVWPPPGLKPGEIEFDHPIYRRAPTIAIAAGVAAAIAVAIFSETPWWMPVMVFFVIAAALYRILRPRLRHPSIEDEL